MQDIKQYLPHRPPFLFVDRILEITDERIHAQKDVLAEEPYFAGHYPDFPIMPGVLICECILQTGAILIASQEKEMGNRVPLATRINNVKLRKPVRPGVMLDLEVTLKDKVSNAWYMAGCAKVDGKIVASLDFSGMLVEAD